MNRFIEGMKIDQDAILTPKRIKELGIPKPGRLTKSLRYIGLISEKNILTDLGRRFIDFRSRKDACREILEKQPYDELVYRMKQGELLSRKKLGEYFEGITGWSADPVDKTVSLLLYFLKNADYNEFKEVELIKNAQTTPKVWTRKGKKDKEE